MCVDGVGWRWWYNTNYQQQSLINCANKCFFSSSFLCSMLRILVPFSRTLLRQWWRDANPDDKSVNTAKQCAGTMQDAFFITQEEEKKRREERITHTWLSDTREINNNLSSFRVVMRPLEPSVRYETVMRGRNMPFSAVSVTWWNGFCATTFFPQPIKASGRVSLCVFGFFFSHSMLLSFCVSHDKETTTPFFSDNWGGLQAAFMLLSNKRTKLFIPIMIFILSLFMVIGRVFLWITNFHVKVFNFNKFWMKFFLIFFVLKFHEICA